MTLYESAAKVHFAMRHSLVTNCKPSGEAVDFTDNTAIHFASEMRGAKTLLPRLSDLYWSNEVVVLCHYLCM